MIGETISLTARDGHVLSAYEARPAARTRGGLVLAQEIFGLTGHIRQVCDGYAAEGYHVVAPAFFDRIRRGVELGYSDELWDDVTDNAGDIADEGPGHRA